MEPDSYIVIITLREWIPLFVLHVLLQVEERIEEDGRHLAPFQIGERDTAGRGWLDHIQHLRGDFPIVNRKSLTKSIVPYLAQAVFKW